MNLSERENAIGDWLRVVVLPRYTRPDYLDDNTAQREVADMVGDINKALPTLPADSFAPFLADVFSKIRMVHTSRQWPPIATFVKAIGGAKKEAAPSTGPKSEYRPDLYAVMAAKMRARQPVGQDYVYGPKAKELMARNLVDEATMTSYRSGLFFALRDAYGPDATSLEAKLIAEHDAMPRPISDAELAAVRAARFNRMTKVEA